MAALRKTTIDYMVIAISPILVTCMVASLALFLSTVFHPSPFESRINLVIIFYSAATVGIARISIEEGKDKAVLYAIPLALVTFIAFSVFNPADGPLSYLAPLVHIGLIAITWWSAHKLTWDSTVIFDHDDSSGQGLLQKVGLDSDTRDPSDRESEEVATDTLGTWFERWQINRKKPHTPGVWVVYYSLAALPLFGLGQTFIQVGHQELRTFCFQLGCIYVGSGLGLLMTTSFLGLRRYLRHRDVEMPQAMANMWLTVGSIMIGILMVGALILPRPGNGPSLKFLADAFDNDDYETSEHAIGNDGFESGPNGNQSSNKNSEPSSGKGEQQDGGEGEQSGENGQDDEQGNSEGEQSGENGQDDEQGSGEGEQSGENGQDDEQGNSEGEQSGENGQGDDQGSGEGEQSGESGQGDGQGNGEGDQQAQESENQPEQNSAQEPPPQSTSNSKILENLVQFLTLLIWIIAGGALLYFLFKNRTSLLKAASEMWHGFWEWLSNLFAGTSSETVTKASDIFETIAERPQPFATFNNPFQGTLKMSPREVIHYSFQALEAWAYEKGIERRGDQTPNEFTREVANNAQTIGTNIEQLGKLYSQEAYAPNSVASSHLPELQRFWSVLLTTPRTPS
ncbi:MAG: DUF4129 domain-containing protein [Planctomycetaceae bacterium]|nr:DUF4129 domain-containing protein [Planctomycetaceae bacterium]